MRRIIFGYISCGTNNAKESLKILARTKKRNKQLNTIEKDLF